MGDYDFKKELKKEIDKHSEEIKEMDIKDFDFTVIVTFFSGLILSCIDNMGVIAITLMAMAVIIVVIKNSFNKISAKKKSRLPNKL